MSTDKVICPTCTTIIDSSIIKYNKFNTMRYREWTGTIDKDQGAYHGRVTGFIIPKPIRPKILKEEKGWVTLSVHPKYDEYMHVYCSNIEYNGKTLDELVNNFILTIDETMINIEEYLQKG